MYCGKKENFLLNYGWKHYWCDPDVFQNFHIKEVVKGPFANPKFVNYVPYVTVCQQDGSPVRLSEGIPDSWSEYLFHSLRLYQNYESMHKEDVDIVPQLRKHYRLYLGQGIPSPWIDNFENYSTLENLKKRDSRLSHRKKFKNYLKKDHCNCCSRKYLFKCPDSCDTNSSSSLKNRPVKNHCCKKCGYVNRISKNHERKNPQKESLASSLKESSLAADDEGENLNEETHHQRNKFPKEQLRECFCPYIKNFYLKKCPAKNKNDNVDHGTQKPPQNHSKLIQAKLPLMISKSVQTERPKVERYTQCFWCNVVHCNSPWGASCKQRINAGGCEISYPTVCPVTSFCFPATCAQNPPFVCPYSFSNHFMTCTPHKENCNGLKKHYFKEKQLRENEDNLNSEFRLNPFQQNEASECNFKWVNTEQVNPNNDFFKNQNMYSSSRLTKAFDHMKYTDDRLKYYLYREKSFPKMQNDKFIQQSSFSRTNFDKGNNPVHYPYRVQLERFKSFCNSTPEPFNEERKISPRERNG